MVLRCASFARERAPLLLQIIHHNQNAYVKGRTIFDAVRTIDDVISFMALKNISSLMTVIDFEKAFEIFFEKLLRGLTLDHLLLLGLKRFSIY